MGDTVIRVENLSKSYIIGHKNRERYKALRDVIINKAKQIGIKTRHMLHGGQLINGSELEEFWALKDINFEITKGTTIGIIGRNGAGKSTLLKILSRITEPTKGRILINGRVASLLEVGTGFHPELSGMENIYLNGAILGMSRKEIKSKFDEIVDFSGIEKFLDTPVKRYSSGMYVRLAFAVAAHLEPEILVVDEVLAVGDAEFQKKCLGKMGKIANEGRTVLFVSHNMAAIETLCSKAMIISKGSNSDIGQSKEIIQQYLHELSTYSGGPLIKRTDRKGFGRIRFNDISFLNRNGENSNVFAIGDDINILLRIQNIYSHPVTVSLGLSISTNFESLISCDSRLKGETYRLAGALETVVSCKIFSPPLNFGNYEVNIIILNGNEPEDWIISAAKFSIESGTFDNRVSTNPFPVLSKFVWDVHSDV